MKKIKLLFFYAVLFFSYTSLAGQVTLSIPMTRSFRLPDGSVDQTGIAPDIRISLPMPETLTDNVDEWTRWVAKELGKSPVHFKSPSSFKKDKFCNVQLADIVMDL